MSNEVFREIGGVPGGCFIPLLRQYIRIDVVIHNVFLLKLHEALYASKYMVYTEL